MTSRLKTAASQVDITAPEYRALLQNLQANIIKSHGRDFTRHIFIELTADAARSRRWLREHLAPKVTSALTHFEAAARRRASPRRSVDGGTSTGFFLTASGYTRLGFDTSAFESQSYRNGMKSHAARAELGNEDPPVAEWAPGFQGEIHGLITLADDSPGALEAQTLSLIESLQGIANVPVLDHGNVLRRQSEAVEHFGYLDGLSQPLFTRQDLDAHAKRHPSSESWDPSAELGLVLVTDPLAPGEDAFGSYLVYRKLRQYVPLFRALVSRLSDALDIDPALAGAYVVGRFQSGTPVVLSQSAAAESSRANDFNYTDDALARRCPFQAHIRKANPRGTAPGTSLEVEKARRIARRGIPYGPPIDAATADNIAADDREVPRGLLFMAFQANIDEQFAFMQRAWIDDARFPTALMGTAPPLPDTGADPLIGQNRAHGLGDPDAATSYRWPARWGQDVAPRRHPFASAVELEGGEYFFAPSLPFLNSL